MWTDMADKIHTFVNSPKTALFVAFILSAVASSGRLNVSMFYIFLITALFIGCSGIYRLKRDSLFRILLSLLLLCGLVLMGVYMGPVPQVKQTDIEGQTAKKKEPDIKTAQPKQSITKEKELNLAKMAPAPREMPKPHVKSEQQLTKKYPAKTEEHKDTEPEHPNFEKLFKSDFNNYMRQSGEDTFVTENKEGKRSLRVLHELCYDFQGKSKFLGFYIPSSPDSYKLCVFLSEEYKKIINDLESKTEVTGGHVTEFSMTSGKDLVFTGRIYIYHEDSFSHQQLAELEQLYKSKGLSVLFRGTEYFIMMWKAKH